MSHQLTKEITLLQKQLQNQSDPKLKSWWENYVKHDTVFRGVNMQTIRKTLDIWYTKNNINNLSNKDQLNLVELFFKSKYSEDKIAGIIFTQKHLIDKVEWKTILNKFNKVFANEYIYDWNICDWLCIKVFSSMIKQNGIDCAQEITKWNTSNNLWQSRASIVSFIGLTQNKAYIPLILKSSQILIQRPERFAKTAVGWIIREISKTESQTAINFINQNQAHFTKETLKSAREYLKKQYSA